MMAYSGGDSFPCVVAEVGSYATKMGFAGEDYPRSYFRSSTAILRDQDPAQKGKIIDRSYDFTTRPLDGGSSSTNKDDGKWELCNPIDRSTGLLCEALPSSTGTTATKSHSSNNDNDNDSPSPRTGPGTSTAPAGECYSHFSSYLDHGYRSALGATEDSSTTPLLLIERSYNPPPIRQKVLEILFEQQNVPATFLARDAVCACYAVGRTTGTVVDVGHGGTVVSPVYEGFVETKGVLRSPVGAAMMEDLILEHLDQLYRKKRARISGRAGLSSAEGAAAAAGGPDYAPPLYQTRAKENKARREPFHRFARLDMARLSKEDGSGAGVAAYGYASLDTTAAASALDASSHSDAQDDPNDIYQQYANAPKIPYKLPDGTVIDIPQTKRFDVAELLFGKDTMSTQKREDAVLKMGKRLNSIILSGGAGGSSGADQAGNSKSNRLKRGGTVGQKTERAGRVRNQPISYLAHQNLLHACTPFLSSSIGEMTSSTIPNMVCDSAFKCDRDQQAQLLGNVVLCGGGACLSKTAVLSSSSADYQYGNAMTERVREEVEAIVHTHTPGWRVKVLSPGPTERAVCSWLGGSILGSLGSFHDMWITKKEYEEHGAAIVNRKCP